MALSIKDPEVDALARELADTTGETITQAVHVALSERLEREKRRRKANWIFEDLEEIRERVARLPVLDPRSPDEIIGYDENGLPK